MNSAPINSQPIPLPEDGPCWDPLLRELCLGTRLVKQFREPAPNQEAILAAFQEEGWPPRIDDPLPNTRDIDAKERLHDTIKNLNRHQVNRLIRFRGDGTGEGVRWELLPPPLPHKLPQSVPSSFRVVSIRFHLCRTSPNWS